MTTRTAWFPSGSAPQAGVFARALAAKAAKLMRALINRRRIAPLLEWDERMLADIGITPGDVRAAVAEPIGNDPSARLRRLADERRAAHRAQARERLARAAEARQSEIKRAA